jgi:N-methylhydantoinase A
MTTRRIRIGIDTGGTFTDVVAVDEDSGQLAVTKTPSTPADPAVGFMAGVHKVLADLDLGGESVTAVSHGTTVATNKLLEGKVENLGFITTEGYEFMLEIARQSVPDGYGNSYFWVKPDRIVPAHRVKTVGGRLSVNGDEIRPFDEQRAVEVARWFRDQGINTLGVCFLHSYVDDGHERAMRDVLAREHPDAVVSISSEVLREYREYERSVTTLVDAAVKPNIRRYVANIAARLVDLAGHGPATNGQTEAAAATVDGSGGRRREAPPDGSGAAAASDGPGGATQAPGQAPPFYVMKSNGGVLSAEEVVHQPITTVLSGPAAGALGAAVVAEAAGFPQVVTCDGGGTSTDVTVVIDGRPALTTEGNVGAYPSKIPMIDVVTVGAGGGSIAWISPEGTLKVGPQSAGAEPGPICYGNGGTEPTITDAHVLLGRIPPHLLGGEVPLDVDLAAQGMDALANKLDLPRERCATGVLEISAWNQANALRQVTVKRGLDVRDFTMVTFGGSGSLLACRLVDVLGLDGVLVPLNPGNLSAYGLLTVDVRNDYVQTAVAKASALDVAAVQKVYDELAGRADAALGREGFPAEERVFLRTADLRYFGQAYEVRVDVPGGPVTDDSVAAVAARFHDEHRGLYGYDFRADPRQEVEWVNLRVTGVGPIRKPSLPQVTAGAGAQRARTGSRRVYFDDWVEAAVYDRGRLGAGDVVEGPAVLEEFSSTVPVHPGFAARVDAHGNLVIRRSAC